MLQVFLNLESDEILRAFTTGAKNKEFRLLLPRGTTPCLTESSRSAGSELAPQRRTLRTVNGVHTSELGARNR